MRGRAIGARLPAVVLLLALIPAKLLADDLGDLFQAPTTDVAPTGQSTQPSLIDQYQQSQKKLSYSFDLLTAGGMYGGWTATPDYSNPWSGFTHSYVGGIVMTPSIDLRPLSYLRIHGSLALTFPNATGDGLGDFGATLDELFFDYGTPGLFSARLGQFGLAWGNARILSAVDLPGRTVNTAALAPDVDIRPVWLTPTNPALWLRLTQPLGGFTLTGLLGVPNATVMSLQAVGGGALLEYVAAKNYFSLSGYYKSSNTPRVAATVKTSLDGVDLFIDSSLSFPDFPKFDYALPVVTGGLYYQTSSGPDIKITAEIRYNGENDPGIGYLVPDALPIGGFSNAVAFGWTSVGGSSFTLGFTWYQSWVDGSGAFIPVLSMNVAPLVTARLVFPYIYGAPGSDYRLNPPAETASYVNGIGLVIVLKSDF